MNAPFLVAQATPVSIVDTPQRVIKLIKPQGDQAISLRLDGSTKLDLSDIASEKVTFVRVGERLVILFDNQATVAVDGFFDSNGQPVQDLTLQLVDNRVISSSEFATLFPITTDQSILPAAGNGAPTSGASFHDASVDGLSDGGNTGLDLLSGDNGAAAGLLSGAKDEGAADTAPSIGAIALGNADDEGLSEGLINGPGDAAGEAASITVSLNVSFGEDVAGRTLGFATSQPGLAGLTSGGQAISFALTVIGGLPTLICYTGADSSDPTHHVFTITLDTEPQSGEYTFTLLQPLDHPIAGTEDTITLSVDFVATDGDGSFAEGTFQVAVNDDSPVAGPVITQLTSEDGGIPAAMLMAPLNVAWGADNFDSTNRQPGVRSIGFTETDPASAASNVTVTGTSSFAGPLTSNGREVLYTLIGGVMIGYVDPADTGIVPQLIGDPSIVFTVSLSDLVSGSYRFILRQPLDNSAPDIDQHRLELTFKFTAVDSDGDPTDGTFKIQIDAAGVISASGATIDYSVLPAGGVFINLDDSAHSADGQTVGADTATNFDGISPKAVGIDRLGGTIVDAVGTDRADVMFGGDEANTLEGGAGADLIYGLGGNDTLRGGIGNDFFIYTRANGDYAGDGADTIFGGADTDTLSVRPASGPNTYGVVAAGQGFRVEINIPGSPGMVLTTQEIEKLEIGLTDGERLYFQNDLIGLTHANIVGDDGVQELETRQLTSATQITAQLFGGNDYFSGGAHAVGVNVDGGGGDDWLQYQNVGTPLRIDLVLGTAIRGGVTDIVTNFEHANGGTQADTIIGTEGFNTLNGGGGDDTLEGQGGADNISGGDGNDTIVYRVGDGSDTVRGGANADTWKVYGDDNVQLVLLTATSATNLVLISGAAGTSVISATDIENVTFDMAGGTDVLTVSGFASDDTITLWGTAASFTVAGTGLPTTTVTGDETIKINGSDGNDIIDASGLNFGAGHVLLDGGVGNDTITGSTSNDTILGAGGDDLFIYNPGNGSSIAGGGSDAMYGDADIDTLKINRLTSGTNDYTVIEFLQRFEVDIDHVGAGTANSLSARQVEKLDIALKDGESVAFEILGLPNETALRTANVVGDDGGQKLSTTFLTSSIQVTAQLLGGADTFYGGAHAVGVNVDGGVGTDLVSYEFVSAPVTINLAAGTALRGVVTDTITNFENAYGGTGNDTIYGTSGDNFLLGGDGDDFFRGGAGSSDYIVGGGGDDTFYYGVGDGFDLINGSEDEETVGTGDTLLVDGDASAQSYILTVVNEFSFNIDSLAGPEIAATNIEKTIIDLAGGTDAFKIEGTGDAETYNINAITLNGQSHVGINIEAGANNVQATDSNYEIATKAVEDIFIATKGGADTVNVVGILDGTDLLYETIYIDTGAGNDTIDLSGRTSGHRVVADGGADADTVKLDFAYGDLPSTAYQKIFDADGTTLIGVKITHVVGGVTVVDEFTNVENFEFNGVTKTLAELFNAPPETAPAIGSGDEDTLIAVVLNGSDVDGSLAGFRIKSVPANGQLYYDLAGTQLIADEQLLNSTGPLTVYFKPNANWNGTATFGYAAVDGVGLADPSPATATVTVAPVNDAPVAVNDVFGFAEDGGSILLTFSILSNDVDADGDVLQRTNLQLVTLGPAGNYSLVNSVVSFSLRLNASGYTVFSYMATDGTATSEAATITINVRPMADDAVLSASSGNEDTAIAVRITLGDTDGSEQASRIELSGFPSGATFNQGALQDGVWVIEDAAGIDLANLKISPPLDYNGVINLGVSVTIVDSATLSDGLVHTQTRITAGAVTVTVDSVNDAPTDIAFHDALDALVAESAGTTTLSVAEQVADTTLVGTATAQDIDTIDTFRYAFVNSGTASQFTSDGRFAINATTGAITVANGALLDYENSGATHSFGYTIRTTDMAGNGVSHDEAVTIALNNVVEIQAPPVANPDLLLLSNGVGAPTGGDWMLNPANGHYYKVVSDEVDFDGFTWTEAKTLAEATGGYLVTITSQTENKFVTVLVNDFAYYGAWIGGSDSATEGTWKWSGGPEAGQALGYTNWAFDPNDANFNPQDRDYVYVNRYTAPFVTDNADWSATSNNDFNSFENIGYVVEHHGVSNQAVSEDAITVFDAGLLKANDTDAEGHAITVTGVSLTSANGAQVSFDSRTNKITYNPTAALDIQALAAGATIEDSFTYTISDGHDGTATGTAKIRVNGANEAVALTVNDTADVTGRYAETNEDRAFPRSIYFDASDQTTLFSGGVGAVTYSYEMVYGTGSGAWIHLNGNAFTGTPGADQDTGLNTSPGGFDLLESPDAGIYVFKVTATDAHGSASTYVAFDAVRYAQYVDSNDINNPAGTLFSSPIARAEYLSHEFSDYLFVDAAGISNELNAGTRSDLLAGYSDANRLNGGDGDDAVYGYAGNDTVLGGRGNDFLDGGAGNDRLDGGNGNDIILGGSGNDTLIGGWHAATVSVTANGDNIASNTGFLQFSFLSGEVGLDFIHSISINLRASLTDSSNVVTGAVFDPTSSSGGTDSDGQGGPNYTLIGGSTITIASNSQAAGSTASGRMDIVFGDHTFGVGEGVNVGIDVDRLFLGNTGSLSAAHGNMFDDVGVTATVTFEDGRTETMIFQGVGTTGAIASFAFADGNDILDGGTGNDTLYGSLGNDKLTGGSGADTFNFAESGTGNADIITDYNFGQGDKLDLSSLLDAAFGTGNNTIADFVKLTYDGTNTKVEVDTNGAQTGHNWSEVATLNNYNSISNKVLVEFEGAVHELNAA